MRRLLIAVLAAAGLVSVACSGSDQASTATVAPYPAPAPVGAGPSATVRPAANFAAITKLALHAYTGPCRLTQRSGRWYQMGQDVSDLPAPIPCANVYALVGRTDDLAPVPHQTYIDVRAVLPGRVTTSTGKLQIRVDQLPGNSWQVTWNAKPGVRIEWLLAFADGNLISAGSGSYLYRGQSASDYPTVDVYGNDLDAPPGDYTGITGPPLPAP